MRKQTADWTFYRTFLQIMRSGTLSSAGRALGLTHPTVRRHLGQLETELGGPLFTRSATGLLPTDLARQVLIHAEAMEKSAESITRAATESAHAIRGVVRISASEIVGAHVLPPILHAIRGQYPALTFDLVLSNVEADVLQREVDVAIRMVRPRQGSLVARKVGAVSVGLYAHASWFARHGEPASLAEIGENSYLIGHHRRTGFADAFAAAGQTIGRDNLAIATDNDLAQFAAVCAGLGIGPIQLPLAARWPELRRVLPAFCPSMEVWVVTHPDLRDVPTFRTVMDAMHHGLRHYLASEKPPEFPAEFPAEFPNIPCP
jgi:DNA-binding transcriptional LysR family regulator